MKAKLKDLLGTYYKTDIAQKRRQKNNRSNSVLFETSYGNLRKKIKNILRLLLVYPSWKPLIYDDKEDLDLIILLLGDTPWVKYIDCSPTNFSKKERQRHTTPPNKSKLIAELDNEHAEDLIDKIVKILERSEPRSSELSKSAQLYATIQMMRFQLGFDYREYLSIKQTLQSQIAELLNYPTSPNRPPSIATTSLIMEWQRKIQTNLSLVFETTKKDYQSIISSTENEREQYAIENGLIFPDPRMHAEIYFKDLCEKDAKLQLLFEPLKKELNRDAISYNWIQSFHSNLIKTLPSIFDDSMMSIQYDILTDDPETNLLKLLTLYRKTQAIEDYIAMHYKDLKYMTSDMTRLYTEQLNAYTDMGVAERLVYSNVETHTLNPLYPKENT